MTISAKHDFHSLKGDGSDDSLVQPSHWNAEHVLTMASGKLLGRHTAGNDLPVEEVTPGNGLRLTAAGVLEPYQVPSAALDQSYDAMVNGRFTGKVQVGGASGLTAFGATVALRLIKSGDDAKMVVARVGAGTNQPPRIYGAKTRAASHGAFANVQEDDILVEFGGYGDDGANHDATGGYMRFRAGENWSSIAHGTYFELFMPEVGTNDVTMVKRFSIDGVGKASFAGDMDGVKILDVLRVRAGPYDGNLSDGWSSTPTISAQATDPSISSMRWNTDDDGGVMVVGKIRNNTIGGTPTAPQANQLLGEYRFAGGNGAGVTTGARIVGRATANWSETAKQSELLFQVINPTNTQFETYLQVRNDYVRVLNDLRILNFAFTIGNDVTDADLSNNASGTVRAARFNPDGTLQMTSNSPATPNVVINKVGTVSAGHDFIRFMKNGTTYGAIENTSTTINFGSFSGVHWSQFFAPDTAPPFKVGTIVATVNAVNEYKMLEWTDAAGVVHHVEYSGRAEIGATVRHKDVDTTVVKQPFGAHLAKFRQANEGDKAVYGVFLGWNDDGDATIASIGTNLIRVAKDAIVTAGDLVTSDSNGCAVVQADDIIRSSTVAKITANVRERTYDDGTYLVPCVLYCG